MQIEEGQICFLQKTLGSFSGLEEIILKTQKLVGLAGYCRMYQYKDFPAVLSVSSIASLCFEQCVRCSL